MRYLVTEAALALDIVGDRPVFLYPNEISDALNPSELLVLALKAIYEQQAQWYTQQFVFVAEGGQVSKCNDLN